MRVLGYMILMYGKEYLRESLLSIRDHVEKFVVLYTPVGSQGYHADIPCPETKEELYEICKDVLGEKLVWSEKQYCNEGEHRGHIFEFSDGYDIIANVDSDEVIEPKDIEGALKLVYESNVRYIGINNFINFWRSFSYYCKDFFQPVRFINLNNADGSANIDCRYYHFSCAQKEETVRYKWAVSGHSSELRKNWVDEVYLAWTPENKITFLHASSFQIWGEALPFDKTTLPDILKQHPNYNKEII